jgi:hypothetical protein
MAQSRFVESYHEYKLNKKFGRKKNFIALSLDSSGGGFLRGRAPRAKAGNSEQMVGMVE